MPVQDRIIITGGPGFGKTTLIRELEKTGSQCIHESSREIIHHQLESGGEMLPWSDLTGFSRLVFRHRLEQFHNSLAGVVFFDRGIPDIAAYLDIASLPIWQELHQACIENRYFETVFITPPWPEIFLNDSERKEDIEAAVKIHDSITSRYIKLGYNIIELPLTDVVSRAAFVRQKLGLGQVII